MSVSNQQDVPNQNPLRQDLPASMMPKPCTVVLFGATGDLTRRKLMPALYNLARQGFLPAGFTVLCVARREFTDDQFRSQTLAAVSEHSRHQPVAGPIWQDFAQGIFYNQVRFNEAGDYGVLRDRLQKLETQRMTGGNRLYYLATAPEFFPTITQHLKAAHLIDNPTDEADTRLIVEKPFGHDLQSARQLNDKLHSAFDESQIYRIDHYLGKETVQNILALRFANAIFEPLWNHRYIDHIQITVAERAGMEGRRGQYYDNSGAARDMVQNHMMQLLSLTAMEPPINMEAQAIRDEKVKVLKAIEPFNKNEVSKACVRGQYGPGTFAGNNITGYRQAQGVNPDSNTETYLALKLHIDNWRWANVPFYLRTGKRLAKRVTEIAIQFRSPPMTMFGQDAQYTPAKNQLVLRVQPDEGISL
ncbi:MAG: glucose-6-phosphate dehydrogenase, partial [Planctomycetota bacterium]